MNCFCPSCTSGQTQRLSVIYASGTLRTRGRPLQTAASFRAKPPKPMTYAGPMTGIFLLFLILGACAAASLPRDSWLLDGALANLLQAAFVFIPVLAWAALAHRYNHTIWPRRFDQWEHSFQCNRCGQVFTA